MKVIQAWLIASLVILWWDNVICQVHMNFQQMSARPADGNEIFRVEAASHANCVYQCVSNKDCLALVYPDSGSVCVGYSSNVTGGTLTVGVKAWRVTGTTISLSSTSCFSYRHHGTMSRGDGIPFSGYEIWCGGGRELGSTIQ
jgi:hypothetical protein